MFDTLPSDNTVNHLFIRTYQPKTVGHAHNYDQILIPLVGNIDMTFTPNNCIQNDTQITVNYGEALFIKRGYYHQYRAKQDFRFLVINLDEVNNGFDAMSPSASVNQHPSPFALNERLLLYISVIEKQLTITYDLKTERLMFELLMDLLRTVDVHKKVDARVTKVINTIKTDLTFPYTLSLMAELACLSDSHFKVLFKEQMGVTPTVYLTELRMQKAQGLLLNTDIPVSIVAEQCGYDSVSSFIRRFAKHYGKTPARLRVSHNLH